MDASEQSHEEHRHCVECRDRSAFAHERATWIRRASGAIAGMSRAVAEQPDCFAVWVLPAMECLADAIAEKAQVLQDNTTCLDGCDQERRLRVVDSQEDVRS